jgi:hypothetical protein
MDEKGPDAFRDGAVVNEGPIHTYEDWRTGRVCSERVIPSELFVDDVDGLYGSPTQMHRVRVIDREVLLESAWAKNDKKVAEAIKRCHVAAPDELGGVQQQVADSVAVGESWRLPSGVDPETGEPTDDGRHVIYIDNAVLNPGGGPHLEEAALPLLGVPLEARDLRLARHQPGAGADRLAGGDEPPAHHVPARLPA